MTPAAESTPPPVALESTLQPFTQPRAPYTQRKTAHVRQGLLVESPRGRPVVYTRRNRLQGKDDRRCLHVCMHYAHTVVESNPSFLYFQLAEYEM